MVGRRGVRFLEDDLVLCGESEKDLRAMVGRFVDILRRRELIFNAGEY